MQRCNLQDERDALQYLLYSLGPNDESEEFKNIILQTIIDSNLIEECNFPHYSFYTFTDDFFTTYEKSESVNWKVEGF
jgi:hypothetical protein